MREMHMALPIDKYAGPAPAASANAPTYEPPRIEVVVTTGELKREALYAGEGYATF